MLIKLRSSVLSTLKIASRVSSRESEFPPTKRVFCESTLNARLAFRRIQWERSPNVTFTRKISVDTPVGCLVVVKNDMISVIIPILNEEKILEKTLSRFQPELKNHELIIVDGGSIDGSISIAEKYGKVIKSERGRAKQLNAGAASAIGEILVFLHADVWLEAGAFAAVETALSSGYVGGGFLQKIDGRSILYRIIEITADMRGKYLKVFYGDSGIFVKRCDFERIGGFPEVPIMEEMEFSKALRELGKTKMVSPRIHISARRWETNGIIRTTAINWLITLLFFLGFSLERLAKLYRNIR